MRFCTSHSHLQRAFENQSCARERVHIPQSAPNLGAHCPINVCPRFIVGTGFIHSKNTSGIGRSLTQSAAGQLKKIHEFAFPVGRHFISSPTYGGPMANLLALRKKRTTETDTPLQFENCGARAHLTPQPPRTRRKPHACWLSKEVL